ncbi:MAG: 3-keto-5-aminohexanoate cleavage protein [Acidimicrobiia bacterium]|nr:MAG: 3-keto-5-aminohexanoate cleavage protein [Acidimicrobiia bacterium]
MSTKIALTCALTGAQQGKEANPNLPEQPDEIITHALDAWNAGASILHIHARDENGKATADVEIFRTIVDGIKAAGCDAVINLTTGGAVAGLPLEERVAVVPELEPEIASYSVGGGALLGRYDNRQGRWVNDRWVPLFSSHQELERVARIFQEHDTRPELEVYHAGMMNNVRDLDSIGALDHPLLVNFVTGIPGEITASTVQNLVFLVDQLPDDAVWQATSIGARNHFRMIGAALAMGGQVRVGMEDNIYIGPGELASSNAQIVERAVRIIREVGFEPADPDETRALLMLTGAGK